MPHPRPTIIAESAIVRKTLLRNEDLAVISIDVIECFGDPAFPEEVDPDVSCTMWNVPVPASTPWEAIAFDLFIFVRRGSITVEWSDCDAFGRIYSQGKLEADAETKQAIVVEKGSQYRIRFMEAGSEIVTTSIPAATPDNIQPLPLRASTGTRSRSATSTPFSSAASYQGYSRVPRSTAVRRHTSDPTSDVFADERNNAKPSNPIMPAQLETGSTAIDVHAEELLSGERSGDSAK